MHLECLHIMARHLPGQNLLWVLFSSDIFLNDFDLNANFPVRTFPFSHSHPRVRERKKESVKEQDYQVQVRVLECRQLAGTQLDPVCTVTVGNQKKHTAVKEQTNCPYWDEVGTMKQSRCLATLV